ncbi:NB-ARC domain-containing protein [Limnospira platensis CENA597]|uniref:NB-ARC domain-containing protein n=1 Tax=Limnospira platensis TaxID=118562 RepID=UPI003DA05BD5
MDVTKVLQLADHLVFQQTEKHLDDSQQTVIKGVWEGKTYDKIADSCHLSERHVRDIGYKLWQILSEALGEDIKKNNFRSTFERLEFNSSQFININSIESSHNLQFYSYPGQPSNREQIHDDIFQKIDLSLAPKIICFSNRETELKRLEEWLLNKGKSRLIAVLGVSGIGKTTLVKRFVDKHLDRFEVIIWRDLKFPESLTSLVNDLLKVSEEEPKVTVSDRLKQLLGFLTEKHCLIILDDVQNLFTRGALVGQYKRDYQDYQNFFRAIADLEHQSNLILISREKCGEMECLDEKLYPIKSLELSGLEDVEILRNMGGGLLKDEDNWLKLIQLYQGNPGYLKQIAFIIHNIFDGHVADFLAENSLIITPEMQFGFQQLFERLSPIEQQLILELSQLDKPLTREDLTESLQLSSMDLINGLQSLQQRYIVTKIRENRLLFKVCPVLREYLLCCQQ